MSNLIQMQTMLFTMMLVRRPMTKTGKIVTGLLLMVCCGGIAGVILWYRLYSLIVCRCKVEAVVRELREETVTASKTNELKTLYAPIFAFTYNGQYIETAPLSASQNVSVTVGQTVTIYVNPQNPKHFRMKGDFDKGFALLWLTLAVPGFLGVLMIISAITS